MGNQIDEAMEEIVRFNKERNAALLTLDKEIILAFSERWGVPLADASCDEIFWRAVHKARTGITEFPPEEIEKSKKWLAEHKSEHWADTS